VSWIDLIVEQQIREAIERGEMHGGAYHGKPLPDADRQRPPGWWAEQFVRRERSRLLRDERQAGYDGWPPQFWRAGSEAALVELVDRANRWVADVNANLTADDAFPLFGCDAVVAAWRRLRTNG
jgi:hypothetical protein